MKVSNEKSKTVVDFFDRIFLNSIKLASVFLYPLSDNDYFSRFVELKLGNTSNFKGLRQKY